LGIGLSVVERLVQMHGGTILASSPGPGKGSTFELRLPTIDAPSLAAHEVGETGFPPKRVLVVDDNSGEAGTGPAALATIDMLRVYPM
jgi:hypothetical protein